MSYETIFAVVPKIEGAKTANDYADIAHLHETYFDTNKILSKDIIKHVKIRDIETFAEQTLANFTSDNASHKWIIEHCDISNDMGYAVISSDKLDELVKIGKMVLDNHPSAPTMLPYTSYDVSYFKNLLVAVAMFEYMQEAIDFNKQVLIYRKL